MKAIFRYKMRAECLHDVYEFCSVVPTEYLQITRPTTKHDCIILFHSTWPLQMIVEKMKSIPDSHVMIETIAPEDLYTGERKPE